MDGWTDEGERKSLVVGGMRDDDEGKERCRWLELLCLVGL